MTAGALIQLEHGTTDRMAFLTLNPQITHFKSVYKKYTNFATQFITNQPILTTGILSFCQDTTITFEIPRDGDAIRDMYLTLELPDIYSDSNYQFQWIKRIGEYIIRSIRLQIDTNQTVDTQYGEWFHANAELTLDAGKKAGYYRMIGNIPELYDPANAPGNNGIYPATATTGFAPSIINRKIYLPLAFWFNQYSAMAFPLIAIQKTIMYITITFRRLQECYTVLDYGVSGKRVKPYSSQHYIGNFLSSAQSGQSSLYVNPRLEINNIFLDNEERKRFALSTHEYLITQVQLIKHSYSTSVITFDLTNINKPVRELVFMIRRSDMEDVNDWSNYTNWNVPDIPPYSVGYINPYGNALTINSGNIVYYKNKNLLKAARIRLMANDIATSDVVNNDNPQSVRLDGKDNLFYNLMENFNANRNIPEEGIYTYSFSLDNSSVQPVGAVNFSSINNKDILLTLTPINPNETMNNSAGGVYSSPYNYIVHVFAVNYDIFKIMGGMAGTMTAN